MSKIKKNIAKAVREIENTTVFSKGHKAAMKMLKKKYNKKGVV